MWTGGFRRGDRVDRISGAPHSDSAGMTKPRTVGELRKTGYAPRSVKTEIRQNLIRKLERGERIFPGIVGYDETVLPQIVPARVMVRPTHWSNCRRIRARDL